MIHISELQIQYDGMLPSQTYFGFINLHSSYYTTQLTIYRPFLPDKLQKFDLSTDVGKISTNKPHVLTAPALAVCTSAARACAQVVYKHATRTGIRAPMHIVRVGEYRVLSGIDRVNDAGRCLPFRSLHSPQCFDIPEAWQQEFNRN
jgi:hypothetical protein